MILFYLPCLVVQLVQFCLDMPLAPRCVFVDCTWTQELHCRFRTPPPLSCMEGRSLLPRDYCMGIIARSAATVCDTDSFRKAPDCKRRRTKEADVNWGCYHVGTLLPSICEYLNGWLPVKAIPRSPPRINTVLVIRDMAPD